MNHSLGRPRRSPESITRRPRRATFSGSTSRRCRGEGYGNLIDNNVNTKLFVRTSHFWFRYQLSRPTVIGSYDITSGNDFETRDPKSWTFEGSFDGLRWVVLDARSNQTFSGRQITNSYVLELDAVSLLPPERLLQPGRQGRLSDFRVSRRRLPACGHGAGHGHERRGQRERHERHRQLVAGERRHEAITCSASPTTVRARPSSPRARRATPTRTSGGASPYLYRVQAFAGSLRGLSLCDLEPRRDRGGGYGAEGPDRSLVDRAHRSVFDDRGRRGREDHRQLDQDQVPHVQLRNLDPAAHERELRRDAVHADVRQRLGRSRSVELDPRRLDDRRGGLLDRDRHPDEPGLFEPPPDPCLYGEPEQPLLVLSPEHHRRYGSGITQVAEWRLFGPVAATMRPPAPRPGSRRRRSPAIRSSSSWTDAAGKLSPESSYTVERATSSSFTANLVKPHHRVGGATSSVHRKPDESEQRPPGIRPKPWPPAQRDISVSEFFAKNRHLLGLRQPTRARRLAQRSRKRSTTRSTPAKRPASCPRSGFTSSRPRPTAYKIGVQDNGPGIVKKQIPLIFGKLLYGSKFHRLRHEPRPAGHRHQAPPACTAC